MSRIMRRTSTIILTVLAMVVAMAATFMGTGAAVAADPPDPSKVPHYFGPWPNWVNSPLTLSQASVTFGNVGQGTGATAVAQVNPVDPNGITSVDITNPGHDYAPGTTVTIAGGSTAATGTVSVSTSNVVIGFTNVQPGAGYTAFNVALTRRRRQWRHGDRFRRRRRGEGHRGRLRLHHADRRLRLPRQPGRRPGHRPRRLQRVRRLSAR